MKKLLSLLSIVILTTSFGGMANALSLHVDSAPNVYLSPDWVPWWNQAKTDVVADSFTNMRSGSFPGTTSADPYDEILYATMDQGQSLHWIYWLPNETIDSLKGRFEVRVAYDWAGYNYYLSDWTQPNNWQFYDDGTNTGVIGSFSLDWWSYDDDASPGDTNGTIYDEVDQADVDALRNLLLANQTYAIGYIRFRDDLSSTDWKEDFIKVEIKAVPEPSTLILLGCGLVGLVGFGRKKFLKN